MPEESWDKRADFDETLEHLSDLFNENFSKYACGGGFVSEEMASRICSGGPTHIHTK